MNEHGFLFLNHVADDVVCRSQTLLYFLPPVGTIQLLLILGALQISPLLVELVTVADHGIPFEIVPHRMDILDVAELQRRIGVVVGFFVATALEAVPFSGKATSRVKNGDFIRLGHLGYLVQ